MAGLRSPAGTLVSADGVLAERLKAQGWVSTDAQPEPAEDATAEPVKRSSGRPKKTK